MKFCTALILASLVNGVAAFSAVAPASSGASTGSPDPVDKSMRGIDSDEGTFDPTAGENPAVTRNNNDKVWVSQVRQIFADIDNRFDSIENGKYTNHPIFFWTISIVNSNF